MGKYYVPSCLLDSDPAAHVMQLPSLLTTEATPTLRDTAQANGIELSCLWMDAAILTIISRIDSHNRAVDAAIIGCQVRCTQASWA